jgi:CxxC-x17-CxxC domain-containing protein
LTEMGSNLREVIELVYQDIDLTCVECNQNFVFTAADQEFHAARGYQNPKRCQTCREQRRAAGGGGYGRGQREMFVTTCSSCGKEAQVPFVPRQDRPVYCSDCYQPKQHTSQW